MMASPFQLIWDLGNKCVKKWVLDVQLHPRSDLNEESNHKGSILVSPLTDGTAVLTVNSSASGCDFRISAPPPLEIRPTPVNESFEYCPESSIISFSEDIIEDQTVRLKLTIDSSYRGSTNEDLTICHPPNGSHLAKSTIKIRSPTR